VHLSHVNQRRATASSRRGLIVVIVVVEVEVEVDFIYPDPSQSWNLGLRYKCDDHIQSMGKDPATYSRGNSYPFCLAEWQPNRQPLLQTYIHHVTWDPTRRAICRLTATIYKLSVYVHV
jgi:hypothetical protein